ncbi:unnamed protein product [Symbiodinium natans]|uniref:Reticulocyte-binding protein 2-like a n=1 Tax=Symbiodinium natans TaxID=878477 RepID=A0A812UVC7_9DINO|nr:unnamed protein product [Symbiodinium natans]
MVAILASGLFTLVILALVSAYWAWLQEFCKKMVRDGTLGGMPCVCYAQQEVANSDMMAAKEGKEGVQAAVDPHMLQYYESYYQSLGYPPGTATQVLGGVAANAQHQMALPAPMMPGAMMQAAPPGTPALQDSAWMQPRPMGLPLALPPSRHPGMMAPPTPQNRGRSPRGNETGKSFGDLVSETNRRPSRQLPLFTDTSLPRMPTPTATPRGVATPRGGEEATLALEDGNTDEAAAGEEVTVTVSKSLEDVKEPQHRPSTADSVLSCLSDSTAGSGPSRPGTGDTAKPSDAEGKPLSPVQEEQEEEDKEGSKDTQTPRSFRTFFNDRVTKLLSNKEGTEPERKLFGSAGGSFSGFFGQFGDASASVSKEVPPDQEVQGDEADEAAKAEKDEAERLAAEEQAAAEAQRRAEAEAERAAAERAAAEKAEADRLEAERLAAERDEAARRAAEEAERLKRLETDRLAAEAAEREAAARAAAQIAEADRLESERLVAERAAAEKAEADRLEVERRAAEAERLAAERVEAARRAAEEAERLAAEAAQREAAARAAAQKAEADRLESERLAAERAAAEKAAAEQAAAEKAAAEKAEAERREAERLEREAAEKEAAEKAAQAARAAQAAAERGVSPRTGKAPPPPPPKAGGEASRSGSKSSAGDRRPPPPPPKGKPAVPGPNLSVETDPDATIGSASASPAGWNRADHSLAGLWHSQQQTPSGSAAPSPLASMAAADGAEVQAESPAGSAPNTERMMGRPPRGPGPMMPGPGLNVETDFEDTLKSNVSMSSDSPSNRRTLMQFSLPGLHL